MKTKFSLLMAAVAIVAFAVPAFANGAALTESGKAVAVGSKILGTSTNATTKVSAGTLICEKVTVTGELTENSGGNVKGVGVGAGAGTTCTVAGKAATVSDITLNSISALSGGENTINVTFKAVIAGTECHFESAGVAFTYTSGGSSLNIKNGDLTGKPAATCEPGTLNGDFSLETDVSPFTALVLD